jgi:hypothetical protein
MEVSSKRRTKLEVSYAERNLLHLLEVVHQSSSDSCFVFS